MARCIRRLPLPTNIPHSITLLAGVILGCVLTSTFTFHVRWCSDKVALSDLSFDRQTVSIIKVNEHIRAHGKGISMESEWQTAQHQECVCGEELKKLRWDVASPTGEWVNDDKKEGGGGEGRDPGLDPTYKASEYITKPSIATFTPSWNLDRFNQSNMNYTDGYNNSNDLGNGQLLSNEFKLRRSLIVAVMVPDDGLMFANEIFDTWGQDVPHILFFISNKANRTEREMMGLPLVEIEGSYQSNVDRSFAIIQYLHLNYMEAFNWFVVVTTGTFIRGKRLEQVLSRIDSSAEVYLGWSAQGRPEDAELLELQSYEFYCLGTAGIVFSNGAMRRLGDNVPHCMKRVQLHNMEGETQWKNWDVEIGRCMSRSLGIQCTQSYEAKVYFYQDFSPKTTIKKKNLKLSSFKNLITYSPVTTPTDHTHLYLHYKKLEFKESLESSRYLQEQVNSLCTVLDEDDKCVVYTCPCQESATAVSCSSKCPGINTVTTLSNPYRPMSKYDLPAWQYFDSMAMFRDDTTIPSYWFNVRKDWKKEIQTVMNQVLLEARAQTGRRLLKFRKIINGYARHNPFRGMEYIVDAEYTDGRNLIKTRTNLVRPLAKNYITVQDNNDKKTKINFIVPISNVNNRFKEFMNMYESCCLKMDSFIHLVLVVYGENDNIFVKDIVHPYLVKYKRAKITIVEGNGVFSRGRALHLGMSTLAPTELAFHCDVDMTIKSSFLHRCRNNAIRSKRVYYPEFFKLYNMDYVYFDTQKPKKLALKRQHGHWASYSFGMLCIYKSDYDDAGGMDTNILGWGEEDVKFYEMVLKIKNLEVFRAPDPGLTHRWHEKHCPSSLSADQLKHCFSSRGENLADRIQLAEYIYTNGYEIKETAHSTANSTSLTASSSPKIT